MNKLNIAFVWHFHQPNYQYNYDSDFLLPWTRLHASKDYLNMLKKVDRFQNIKLNFDFSPVLLSALQKYLKGAKDIHLKLLIKDVNELSEQDKIFILNNYFDVNYKNMVLTRQYFSELYNKRADFRELNVDTFTNNEYSDIMANFTLLWIDKSFTDDYPELDELFKKEITTINLPARNHGEWSGRLYSDVFDEYGPKAIIQKPEGGEALEEFNKRVSETIDKLVEENKGNRIIIVTTQDVIQSAVAKTLNLSPVNQFKNLIKTGSLTQISYFEDDWSSIIYSDYVPI